MDLLAIMTLNALEFHSPALPTSIALKDTRARTIFACRNVHQTMNALSMKNAYVEIACVRIFPNVLNSINNYLFVFQLLAV